MPYDIPDDAIENISEQLGFNDPIGAFEYAELLLAYENSETPYTEELVYLLEINYNICYSNLILYKSRLEQVRSRPNKNDYKAVIDTELKSITQALGGSVKQWLYLHFAGPTRDIQDLIGGYLEKNSDFKYKRSSDWEDELKREHKSLLNEAERMHRIKNLFDSLELQLPRVTTGARKYNRYDPVNNLVEHNGSDDSQQSDDASVNKLES